MMYRLYACLAFLVATVEGLPFQITQFDDDAAIKVIHWGQVYLIAGKINLKSEIDLSMLHQGFQPLVQDYNILENMCSRLQSDPTYQGIRQSSATNCKHTLTQFNATLTDLQLKMDSFFPKRRHRRGLLNAGGKALKYIFGTATQDDTDKLTENTNLMNVRLESAQKLVKLHSVNLNLTFHMFQNFYDQHRKSLNDIKNQMVSVENNMAYYTSFLQHFEHITLTYSQMLEHLSNILSFSDNGLVYSGLMQNSQLESALEQVKRNLPPGIFIPYLETDLIRGISTVQVKRQAQQIIITLAIPYVYNNEFSAIRMVPLIQKSTYDPSISVFLNTSNRMHMVDDINKQYFTYEEEAFFDRCIQLGKDSKICNQPSDFTLTPITEHCILTNIYNLTTQQKKFQNCEKSLLRIQNPLFIRTNQPMELLFQIPGKRADFQIHCTDHDMSIIKISLHSNGNLRFKNPSCQLIGENFNFVPSTIQLETTINVTSEIILAQLNVGNFLDIKGDIPVFPRNMSSDLQYMEHFGRWGKSIQQMNDAQDWCDSALRTTAQFITPTTLSVSGGTILLIGIGFTLGYAAMKRKMFKRGSTKGLNIEVNQAFELPPPPTGV